MKFKLLSNYIERFFTFCKRAAFDSYQPKSLQHALQLLDLTEPFTLESVKSAHKKMVVKHHPDRGGDEETLKKINAAFDYVKSYLENGVEPPKIEPVVKSEIDPDIYNLSYEDIAELRKEMGRDEFEAKFPEWLSELKSEMGLDQYNKIFENYDPSYNPEDDEEYQRNRRDLEDYILSEIYESIHLDTIDEDLVTEEDLLWLMSNISETDDVLEHLQSLGALIEKDRLNKLLKHINENKLKKELKEIVKEKVKSFFKWHAKHQDVIENISLLDIIKNTVGSDFFDEKFHYLAFQLRKIVTPEFLSYLEKSAKEKANSLKLKRDLSLVSKERQAWHLAFELRSFLTSEGFDPNKSAIVESAFKELAEKDSVLFKKMIDLANPINY